MFAFGLLNLFKFLAGMLVEVSKVQLFFPGPRGTNFWIYNILFA
jgi:hypothetical protein